MLQNAKVTAFTVSELLRENEQEGEKVIILIFWTKVAQKEYFRIKTEKSHFCMYLWSLIAILKVH